MKKVLLSGFVILSFIFYAFLQRTEGDEEVQVTPPKSLDVSGQVSPTETSQSFSSLTPSPSQAPQIKLGNGLKDGQYTGDVTDAFYGNVQIKAIISGGKITDVQFLQYPNDRSTSIQINRQAMPYLTQEAIQAQSAQVDIVSGATQTSLAFRQSLASALNQAK